MTVRTNRTMITNGIFRTFVAAGFGRSAERLVVLRMTPNRGATATNGSRECSSVLFAGAERSEP